MAELTELVPTKTMCYGYPNNDSSNMLAAAALLNNNSSNMGEMAALMNGGMGQWNNPFIYLVWMMFANRFFGNGSNDTPGQQTQNVEVMSQLSAIRETLSSNQNTSLVMDAIKGNSSAIHELANNLNTDYNTLSQSICDIKSAIQTVGGQIGYTSEKVINSMLLGNNQLIQAVQNTACETQRSIDRSSCMTQQSILKMGYDNQIQTLNQTNQIQQGLNYLSTGIERGFSSTAYATQQQTCAIIDAINAAQQRNSDLLNGHWNQELQIKYQDAKMELSQQNQTAALIAALKTTSTTTT